MSHDSQRGDMEHSDLVKTSQPYVFLDYGELIFHYDFNKNTLERAHNIAFEHIRSRKEFGVNFSLEIEQLRGVHNHVIQQYLQARKKDNSDWSLSTMVGLMLQNLELEDHISEEALTNIYKIYDHDVQPMATTIESIPELTSLARLGIISNLPHDSMKYELPRYGLTGVFDPIVISYEVGFRKPHPAIYREALSRIGNPKAEKVTFFSHDQEEVDGALAIGMQGQLVKNLGEVLAKLKTSSR